MAAPDIEQGDELLCEPSGRMVLAKRFDNCTTLLPVAFDGIHDYFDWHKRNAKHLPPQLVTAVGVMEAAYIQKELSDD